MVQAEKVQRFGHRPELEHRRFLLHLAVPPQLLDRSLELKFGRGALWPLVSYLQHQLLLGQTLNNVMEEQTKNFNSCISSAPRIVQYINIQ